MAKKKNEQSSDDPDECAWCRPGSAALKVEVVRLSSVGPERQHSYHATPAKKQEDDPEITWISCTRCKAWYHYDCVSLQELVSRVDANAGTDVPPAAVHAMFPTPGSSGSLPLEVINEIKIQGMEWDWCSSLDKWYCTPCIVVSHKNHEHNSRAKILRSTLKKDCIFPSAEADPEPDFPQDAHQATHQDAPQDALPDIPQPSIRAKKAVEPPRPKRKATLERPDYHALHNNISTPTSKWLALIRDPAKSGRKIREAHYPRIDGSMLRKSWLDDTYESDLPAEISPDVFYGPDREPIIVPKSRGGFESLGGKVPSHENFGIDDVVKLVGKDYMVDVIDVATQASSKWSLAQWAYYFKTDIPPSGDSRHSTSHNKHLDLDNMAAPQKVYNVISLECTGTELAKLVRPPRLVKELDWVDNCWPDIKKKRKSSHPNLDPRSAKGETHAVDVSHSASYTLDPRNRDDPMAGTANSVEQRSDALGDDSVAGKRKLDGDGWPKVKLYCLMGKAGSWTDWHVDFAASCVYYTVITGSKVFYFIKPTPANLAAYARWSSNEETQQKEWLGDLAEGPVEKVTLKQGDTMIIPSGYIHAVYTPEDTIVLGGNFLHSYNIEAQLRLREIEIETKVPQRMRFPYFDKLCWYVAEYWVKQLRERTAYRPSASGQAHSGEDPIPIRVLEGLNALAEFLVGESSTLENPLTDAKKRKSIYDRIPKEVVTNASTLARDLQWRARQMLAKAKEGEDEGAVAADQGQAVEAERGTKRRKPQSNGDSKANGHKRPRLKNVTASPWEHLEESTKETEQFILRPRPPLTDPSRRTSGAQDYIAKEEVETIMQRKKRVREDDSGDLVEDTVEVTTVTRTRTWTNKPQVKQEWEERLRLNELKLQE